MLPGESRKIFMIFGHVGFLVLDLSCTDLP